MKTVTKKRLVLVLGLLLTPVIGVLLFAGASTFDGGIVGTVLIVTVPLALYAAGFHLVLKGLTEQMRDQNSDAA